MRSSRVETSASRRRVPGVAVHAGSGVFRDRRWCLTEVRSGARASRLRVVGLSRGPAMALVRPRGDGLTFAGRASWRYQLELGGSDPSWPSLAAWYLGGLLAEPALSSPPPSDLPRGGVDEGARPAPAIRRRRSGRAIPPARHPKMPCSRRSSRRAGASPHPEGWDEPDTWSGGRFPGALPEPVGACIYPGHRRLLAVLVSRRPESPPKEVVSDPAGSRGATASGGPRRVLPDSSHG